MDKWDDTVDGDGKLEETDTWLGMLMVRGVV